MKIDGFKEKLGLRNSNKLNEKLDYNKTKFQ